MFFFLFFFFFHNPVISRLWDVSLSISCRAVSSRQLSLVDASGSSHDDTLGAAAGLVAAVVHVHLLGGAVESGATSATGGVALHFAVEAANLADNVVEGLIDIDSRLGRGLNELAVEGSSQGLALCS